MKSSVLPLILGLVSYGSAACCLAQSGSGPATLENLLDDSRRPPLRIAKIEDGTPRQPVPQEEAVEEARKLIKQVYEDDYTLAGSNPEPFLQKLITAFPQTADAARQYAMLLEAEAVAVAAGEFVRAFEIVDIRTSHFEEDAVQVLGKRVDEYFTPRMKNNWAALGTLFALAKETTARGLAEDRIDESRAAVFLTMNIARAMQSLAGERNDDGLTVSADACVDQAQQMMTAVNRRSMKAKAYREALETLKNDPDSPAANTVVGEYRCFVVGEWEHGLDALAKGDQGEVKAVAAEDLALSETGDLDARRVSDVAGRWWQAAEAMKKDAERSAAMRWRAAELYGRVVDALQDPLDRQLAASRIDKVRQNADALDWSSGLTHRVRQKWTLVLWNTHNARWRDRGTKTCDVRVTHAGKTVFEKKNIEVPWHRDRDASLAIPMLLPGVDTVRVSITSWNGAAGGSGGLAEIQLFDGTETNKAPEYAIHSSTGEAQDSLKVLQDGDTAAGGESRWCLPNETLGWVELTRVAVQRGGVQADRDGDRATNEQGETECTEIVGEERGTALEDNIPANAVILGVRVRSGGGVDAIQVVYRLGTTRIVDGKHHGGTGGFPKEFQLLAGERITAISGQVRGTIGAIQFHTNRRTSPVYGTPTKDGKPFTLELPPGAKFAGFSSRFGRYLDAVGLRYHLKK